MKFLLLAAIVLVVYLLWRSARRPSSGAPPQARLEDPQQMVQCATCAVHLPAGDAVPGKLGSYCCVQHRDQKEG
jgi:uncharacterized protein